MQDNSSVRLPKSFDKKNNMSSSCLVCIKPFAVCAANEFKKRQNKLQFHDALFAHLLPVAGKLRHNVLHLSSRVSIGTMCLLATIWSAILCWSLCSRCV